MGEKVFDGGCQCGAVRYRARGTPDNVNACYCTQCRRQTGSAMPVFATWPLARFELVRGKPGSYRSSDRAVRQFCPDCGSPLFWKGDGRNDIDVLIGSLDAPERVPAPEDQIWTRHRLPWVPHLPGIRDYPEGRGG